MKDAIILDIETSAGDNLPDAPEAILMKGVRADFKPDTVERKREENKKAWAEKAALDWRTGQVIAVGALAQNDDPWIITQQSLEGYSGEAALLSEVWDWMFIRRRELEVVAGFNIRSFDIPYLIGRSAVCGVKPSRTFKLAKFRTDLGVVDWCDILSNWDPSHLIGWTLDYYANVFGLENQPLGDSSKVPKRWVDGDYDYVIEHLREDLLTTRELHDRFAPAFLGD